MSIIRCLAAVNIHEPLKVRLKRKKQENIGINVGIKDSFKFIIIIHIRTYRVRLWLLYNCPKVIEPPPQSPDMNPIENIWNELDRQNCTSETGFVHYRAKKKTSGRMEQK